MSEDQVDSSKQLIGNFLAIGFTEPTSFMGVETKLFQLNAFIGFFVILMLKMLWWIPLVFVFHFIFRWATKSDPKIREIYIKYQFQGDHYEPWGGIPPTSNKRPIGFGRNESC